MRRILFVAAVLMCAGVFVAGELRPGATAPLGLLYVVPITLAALELGLLGGLGAALISLSLIGVWALGTDLDLGPFAIIARAVAFAAVGVIAGRFGDRMRDAHRRQFLLLKSGLTLAHLDVGEDLPATVAAQARELLSARGARVELIDGPTGEAGQPSAAEPEDRLPIEVRGVRYGTLAVSEPRGTSLEDHAMLAILALQAAVAAENRRLLADERERAAIRSELRDARVHLAERGHQLRELIVRQEEERHQLAYELNEQAAQSLAAVLLGLAAFERELGSATASPRLGAMRGDIDRTLRSLRALAVSLRPPSLALGLRTALERLAERRLATARGEMSIELEGAQLNGEEAETMVYRVIEEALDAVGAARRVAVSTRAAGSELLVDVEDAEHPIAQRRLAVLRARMELVGGSLTATPTQLHVVIPLHAAADEAGMPVPS